MTGYPLAGARDVDAHPDFPALERAVLEYHPDNPAEHQVLLRHVGAEVLDARGW